MKLTLNAKTVFYSMCILVAAIIGLTVAGIYFGDKLLMSKSDKLVALKLQYRVPEQNQITLRQAKADIQKYAELKNIAKSIVPQEKDQARTVREIVNDANSTIDPVTKSSISVLSITFPTSTLGQAAPVVSSGSASSATPKPLPLASNGNLSQLQPVVGIPGVYILPITVQSDPKVPVTFNQITSFLAKLEQNRRTAQVGQISIARAGDAKSQHGLSFTLIVNVYIKP